MNGSQPSAHAVAHLSARLHSPRAKATTRVPASIEIPAKSLPAVLSSTLFVRPLLPSPQSQTLFRRYCSILPTSLNYIILLGQSLFNFETGCGYVYGQCRAHLSPRFSWAVADAPDTPKGQSALPPRRAPSPVNLLPGPLSVTVKKKR